MRVFDALIYTLSLFLIALILILIVKLVPVASLILLSLGVAGIIIEMSYD